ncbi:MAG TPA: nucleoside triphosphate pyrophosphohydrolase [Porticoccaceae bacterium]|nr:nucleoside triphosphate pyrophosphohydrolase [Porticoccaceae bacterium]
MTQHLFSIADLRQLMRRLRDPDTGCPWDLKQDFQTILPYTLEEVYEVIDAADNADYPHLKEELGDLLFQIVFLSQLAEEQAYFDFSDVVSQITEKLLKRHPHVFPDGTLQSVRESDADIDIQAITNRWEAMKTIERRARGAPALLDDVPMALPAMSRAIKLQKRAAKVGFDWDDLTDVVAKVREELGELDDAVLSGKPSAVEDEFGDLLFTCMNLARHLGVDPERSLRGANQKFTRRFQEMESQSRDRTLSACSTQQLASLWETVKAAERPDTHDD